MAKSDLEPFPPLAGTTTSSATKENHLAHGKVQRRRKSSALGGELPGDSDVAAFATLRSPPLTPTTEYAVRRASGAFTLRAEIADAAYSALIRQAAARSPGP